MRGGIAVVAFVLACGFAGARGPDRVLGDPRWRVRGGAALAYAADGRLGVLGTRGISVFDRSGAVVEVRPGPAPAPGRAALAPDLARVLVIEDGRAALWDGGRAAPPVVAFRARDGEPLEDAPLELADPLEHRNRYVPVERVRRVGLAPGGDAWEIVHDAGWSAGDVGLRLALSDSPADISTEIKLTRDLGASVIARARSIDGAELAVLTEGSGRVRRLKLPSFEDADTLGHTAPIDAVAAAADGKRVFTGAHDGVRIWDLRSGKAIVHLRPDVPCRALAVSADGTRLLVARGDIADLIEAPEGRVMRTVAAGATIRTVALSADGARATIVTDASALTFQVSPWSRIEGERVEAPAAIPAPAYPEARVRVTAAAGPHLVAGCDDGTLVVWSDALGGRR
jgi:hypothetical protein